MLGSLIFYNPTLNQNQDQKFKPNPKNVVIAKQMFVHLCPSEVLDINQIHIQHDWYNYLTTKVVSARADYYDDHDDYDGTTSKQLSKNINDKSHFGRDAVLFKRDVFINNVKHEVIVDESSVIRANKTVLFLALK
jgi:hypothetical protein